MRNVHVLSHLFVMNDYTDSLHVVCCSDSKLKIDLVKEVLVQRTEVPYYVSGVKVGSL